MMFAGHSFQSASNVFPLFAFEMGDGDLQIGPVSFIEFLQWPVSPAKRVWLRREGKGEI